MGFQKPSKIQERALPLLLGNPYGLLHKSIRYRNVEVGERNTDLEI
jgi:superfamily II DNA/RNA helicase